MGLYDSTTIGVVVDKTKATKSTSTSDMPPSIYKERIMKDEFGVQLFEDLIDHLWENRAQVKNEDFYFDYPDYGDLPKRIHDKLSSEAVDIIQETYDKETMKNFRVKKTFRNWMKFYFFKLS